MFNTNPLGKLDPNRRPSQASPLELPHRGHGVPLPQEAHEREVPAWLAGDILDVAAPEEQLRQVGRRDAGRQAAHPQVPRRRRHSPARPPTREWEVRILLDADAVTDRPLVARRPAAEPPPSTRAAAVPRHLQKKNDPDWSAQLHFHRSKRMELYHWRLAPAACGGD